MELGLHLSSAWVEPGLPGAWEAGVSAWLLTAIAFAVLWTWWQLLIFTLKLIERARDRSVPYWGEAEDSPNLKEARGLSDS